MKFLKTVKRITDEIAKKKKGMITIRPISFGMDKTIDKYVVSGGGWDTVVHRGGKLGRKLAMTTAKAREKIMKKRRKEK